MQKGVISYFPGDWAHRSSDCLTTPLRDHNVVTAFGTTKK